MLPSDARARLARDAFPFGSPLLVGLILPARWVARDDGWGYIAWARRNDGAGIPARCRHNFNLGVHTRKTAINSHYDVLEVFVRLRRRDVVVVEVEVVGSCKRRDNRQVLR